MGIAADDRFWVRGKPEGECVVFVGSRDRQGYGHILRTAISKSPMQAHRYAWMLTNGPIPAGKVVMHSCDNPPCIRPEHLVLGTQGDNIADRDAKGRHRPGRQRGEAHHQAKLDSDDVLMIRRLAKDGARAIDLARAYGVHPATISNIVARRNWRHLEEAA